jgi:penicillin amidase
MNQRYSRLKRAFRIGIGVFVLLLVASAALVIGLVRGSLPVLDGERAVESLEASVEIHRDGLGIPDIVAAGRADAARALGYLHAQDRFFQMDLQRRRAAGELAALLGPALRTTDLEVRVHRFRARALEKLGSLSPEHRRLLEAYAVGVNAGLDDLRVRPVEYLVLRQRPAPWRPEDSILTLHAMFLDLSLWGASYEATCSAVRDQLPADLVELLLPWSNPWDAPLQPGPVAAIEIPDSTVVDVRDWRFGDKSWDDFRTELLATEPQDQAGSNNWAVAGQLTAHGGAIVANDMHLGHQLPNIWYRARMSWPEGDGRRALVGVTLPGTPALVVGSNGDVAWGFTNTQGDWADLVVLELDEADSTRYRTPEGWRTIERVAEVIEVAGAAPDTVWVEQTIWGPVTGCDTLGRSLALRWTAHDDDAVNLDLFEIERATTVDEVVAIAGGLGIPAQNLVCADRSGRIGWALAGRIPRRIGWDGRSSVSWADGTHRWEGYVGPDRTPRVVDPDEGLLWTANNRVTSGEDLALVGDGGYALGARASQIRDDLRALPDGATEEDLLAIALDDRALFQGQWRGLALEMLADAPPDSLRDQFLEVVRDEWSGRAEPASVSYRLVRGFTYHCVDNVYDLLTGKVAEVDEDFRADWLPYRHAVTWKILHERPAHLLPPWFEDWDALVLDAIDRTMESVVASGLPLEEYTWGARNRVEVAHPFAMLDARLARWFAAEEVALPGDSFMPRVQHQRHGASERMVVAPGREHLGIMHMPGGQSGHPWSPWFLAGHEAWQNGEASSLLPGEVRHRFRLVPMEQRRSGPG